MVRRGRESTNLNMKISCAFVSLTALYFCDFMFLLAMWRSHALSSSTASLPPDREVAAEQEAQLTKKINRRESGITSDQTHHCPSAISKPTTLLNRAMSVKTRNI